MSSSRQLAAIMFTDIVGYTALMGRDEHRAFELLKKNREIQRPVIEQYGGRWIKELGDGVLASFNNVSDAVHAAIKIQEQCEATHDFQLRIGIHQGDVVFEEDDVFGDAVNIASRIQVIANPGSIYVSESVHLNLSSLSHISTRFVKEESLKNVKEAVKIYEVIMDSTPVASFSKQEEQSNKVLEKSIAVLPFSNMSNDPDQDYFGEGIAEEIINSLVHIKDLKIAGRTSSAQFKGKNIDLRQIGKMLGVGSVLEGSVRKQGNHLRITAQLINVEDGFHLWSERYDRNMDDIFAIQDEIALAITEKLKITLFSTDLETITRVATQNTEAYELVLKGRFHINRRGSSIISGLELFKQAISIDPEYSLAYSGYAWANYLMAFYSFLPGGEVMNIVKQAAETAIKLDNTLAEGYCYLANYFFGIERNWTESKKNFLKAIELNPNFVQGYSLYSLSYLNWVEGNFEEAEKQGRLAIKLEPLSAIDHADLSWVLYTARKYDEALAIALAGIELDANSFLSQRLAGLCYLGLNQAQKAIETFRYLMDISNRHQHALNSLIWAHSSNGEFDAAKTLMDELIKRSETEYVGGTYAGISAACLGDLDLAFSFLEKAYEDRDPILMQIKTSPVVPFVLNQDNRFKNLIDRIAYPVQ